MDSVSASASLGATRYAPSAETPPPPMGYVADAYSRHGVEQRCAKPPPPTLATIEQAFFKELSSAVRCVQKLKTLRRTFAWRLHPDRWPQEERGASQAMARCNAAIDAAIAKRIVATR